MKTNRRWGTLLSFLPLQYDDICPLTICNVSDPCWNWSDFASSFVFFWLFEITINSVLLFFRGMLKLLHLCVILTLQIPLQYCLVFFFFYQTFFLMQSGACVETTSLFKILYLGTSSEIAAKAYFLYCFCSKHNTDCVACTLQVKLLIWLSDAFKVPSDPTPSAQLPDGRSCT